MNKEFNISNINKDTGQNKNPITSKLELNNRKLFLKDKTIGISISESDELNNLGYDVAHLNDLIIETARYILSLGGKLAYGGDMRNGGITEIIFDLLNYYKADPSIQMNERFHSYLAWPISLNLSPSQEAELSHSVSFHKVSPPTELKNKIELDKFLKPTSKEDFYIWSKSLTAMRKEMDSQCDARIFVGGKTQVFKGKCPGVLEELILAIEQQQPIYLIGTFGGITHEAISGINGVRSNRLRKDFYLNNKDYSDFYEYYNQNSKDIIDFNSYFNTLNELSWKGLSDLNGLTIVENKRLSSTPHLTEIIFLILKGLKSKFIM